MLFKDRYGAQTHFLPGRALQALVMVDQPFYDAMIERYELHRIDLYLIFI